MGAVALDTRGRRRGWHVRRHRTDDAYRAGEDLIVVHAGDRRPDGAIPMVYLHGVLGSAATVSAAAPMQMLAGVIALGHPVLLADYGGANGWGQDDIVDPSGAIDDVLTYAAATYGVRTDQVIVAGESAGSVSAQVWASRRPQQTAALWCVAVIPGLDDFYQANPSIQAAIDSAYGGHPTYLTQLSTHDPEQLRGALGTLRGRARFDSQADDELIDNGSVAVHAAAIGALHYTHPGLHGDAYTTRIARDVAVWLDGVVN